MSADPTHSHSQSHSHGHGHHGHEHGFSADDFDLPDDKRKYAVRITWLGAIINGILGVAKVVVGWLFASHALIADGIHSLSDLVTDFMVVFIVNISHAEPDEDHPYGHERFETLGTVALGFLLVAVAGAMAYDSILNLFTNTEARIPGWPALVVALASLIAKEWVFRFTLAAGKKLGSDLLIANAWHSRTDAYSSLVVLIGVGGAMLGFPWFDSLAAVAVAIFVAKIGWDLCFDSLRELVDTALPADELKELTDEVMQVEGVIAVHSFKSRRMGSKSLLEMHIQVAPYISSSESHYIGDSAVQRLKVKFPSIGHVVFHIDTEDDDDPNFCAVLPLRSEVKSVVDSTLNQIAPELQRSRINLHYLSGQIEIDLFIDGGDGGHLVRDIEIHHQLTDQLNQQLSSHSWFRKLTLWSAG
ncbi:cation transporter [Motiliproteus coralliicola]|uniref:Cation transporter n=1 Tax=Motiliproteus coralliicola TaxID=2283196 RepID=A0A369WTA0_9GAMM|nr:cation diffusion facilitator family transporter [Motiliproteus coralliicola]RDE24289.1 cation transporter [Motiliproteus coralliicola]